jgi:hypothetical protein
MHTHDSTSDVESKDAVRQAYERLLTFERKRVRTAPLRAMENTWALLFSRLNGAERTIRPLSLKASSSRSPALLRSEPMRIPIELRVRPPVTLSSFTRFLPEASKCASRNPWSNLLAESLDRLQMAIP